MSVSAALGLRKTIREFSTQDLPEQLLANLLWAAFGVNRESGPFGIHGRVAASASNSQEIDLYIAMKEGVYLYDGINNLLNPVIDSDWRSLTLTPGQKAMSTIAPVQLIYVVDVKRLTDTKGFEEPGLHDPEVQKSYYFVDTGLIAGNVHLFCAAYGLAAWFHNCDKVKIAHQLSLRADQRVLFAQSIGYAASQ